MPTGKSLLALTLAVGCSLLAPPSLEAIEAIKGKNYKLTERHGPWMVMVASFRDVPPDRREPGLTAREAAMELVYELRRHGIPAYTFEQGAVVETLNTRDRLGRADQRIFAAQRDMISVLAGNYPGIDDENGLAQRTLRYVKRFQPKFLSEEKSGALFRKTPGRPGPLAGAFLTINPLLDPNEVTSQQADQLLVKLNSGVDHSLLENRGKYTLVIATFRMRSVTPIGSSGYRGREEMFDRAILDAEKPDLNDAGEDAAQLTRLLRQRGFEAFVYHDRYQSLVTVGSFDSTADANIVRGLEIFGAKIKTDPTTGKDVLVSEVLTMQGRNPKDPPYRTWIFDPYPKLIEVPRLR